MLIKCVPRLVDGRVDGRQEIARICSDGLSGIAGCNAHRERVRRLVEPAPFEVESNLRDKPIAKIFLRAFVVITVHPLGTVTGYFKSYTAQGIQVTSGGNPYFGVHKVELVG